MRRFPATSALHPHSNAPNNYAETIPRDQEEEWIQFPDQQ